jgi:lactoylglutathione lyase
VSKTSIVDLATVEYRLDQTVLPIRDTEISTKFYTEVLGQNLIKLINFNAIRFSLVFVKFIRPSDNLSAEPDALIRCGFSRKAKLELTRDRGVEADGAFANCITGAARRGG